MDTLSSKYGIYTAVEKVTSPWVFPVRELLHREMIGADSGCIQGSIFTPENKASCPIFWPTQATKNSFEESLWFVKLPFADICCKRGFKNGQDPDITPDIRTFSPLAWNISNASLISLCTPVLQLYSPHQIPPDDIINFAVIVVWFEGSDTSCMQVTLNHVRMADGENL